MADAVKRVRGRPPLPEGKARTRNVTFRIRPDLRQRLQDMADANQRSLSGEIEMCLERYFERGEMLRAIGRAFMAQAS